MQNLLEIKILHLLLSYCKFKARKTSTVFVNAVPNWARSTDNKTEGLTKDIYMDWLLCDKIC